LKGVYLYHTKYTLIAAKRLPVS